MQLDHKLLVSSSPHIKGEDDTRSIMLDVIIALMFPLIVAVYSFGWRSLTLTLTSVAASIAFEWLYRYFLKKPSTVYDLSAVVTGMLLAFNLPVSTPLWIPVIGAFFAIVVVKQLYGGLGKNFMNPALAARAFLFSWPALISLWTRPGTQMSLFDSVTRAGLSPDAIVSATPLAKMKLGLLPSSVSPDIAGDFAMSLRDVFTGNVAGCIGEVSAVVILAAAIYLIVRKVITVHVPLAYLGTVAVLTFLFPLGGNDPLQWMLYSLCSGGLMLGAVFMATDYATSPVSKRGKVIFGIGCGVITVLIRYFGSYSEGVSYAILIMNLCVWAIDRFSRPRRFGVKRFAKAGGRSGK
ncbi:MAG: RnfABCDGE type electron transport complex subunit D [Clostridia bacterium]